MPDVTPTFNVATECSDRIGNTGPPDCTRSRISQVRLLILVEGINDIEFLNRLSRRLHQADSCLPDLATLESDGTVLFIPVGGSDLPVWERRLSGLGLLEFHLYDRDIEPNTAARRITVEAINGRLNARATLTEKRQMENYLHSDAIHAALGIQISVDDDRDVPEIAARTCYRPVNGQPPWEELPLRARKRMQYQAKRWLNRDAVDQMTMARLDERDPSAEVRGWLSTIAEMLK